MEADGHVLLHAPVAKGLLAGLWRWPALDAETIPAQPIAPGAPSLTAWPGWTQVYTHRREAVSPLHLRLEARFEAAAGLHWVPLAQLSALPLGKRDQRLRDLLATPGQTPIEVPDPAAFIRACAVPSA
jgi:A/G-specific adenine glycosylase